mgnify:CR=1 FL=1
MPKPQGNIYIGKYVLYGYKTSGQDRTAAERN